MELLKEEIQHFIQDFRGQVTDLLLKKTVFSTISNKELVEQIEGRRTAMKKFPFLLTKGIIFPKGLNMEQCSSEATARYKARVLELKGEHFVDMTCGFGVDAYFLSEGFERVTLVERDEELLSKVEHNWEVLGRKASFENREAEVFLEHTPYKFNAIYIDPARRDANNGKKFLLGDLSPNILELQEMLLQKSDKVVTKLSPLIDLSYLLMTLREVTHLYLIAVRNEMKEVLVVQENGVEDREAKIVCVNLETEEPSLFFSYKEMLQAKSSYGRVKRYLYIPNNALLKSGAFHYIAIYYGLEKLDVNTHLYTSDELKSSFAGRILEVRIINPKELEKGSKYCILSKNYPLSVEEIKKRYKLKEGGDRYLIFTRCEGSLVVLFGKVVR